MPKENQNGSDIDAKMYQITKQMWKQKIYRYFPTSGADREDCDSEKIQNGYKKVPTTTNMEPKGCQNDSRDL